ncbi:ABC transporter ATP-binding protein [Aquibacillus salsiterrae]|uniref:ABC transporter ATP-binding protein n=1 Tax=Aquibacillus salsiterrae TaxID=2950439 RepID=A0A9X4AGW3_9BACI|nr:ABC transporter ATP-binding protein [Aquibacillus salsiterrae]MDC3417563.1 ABC transporter ATP-binding protein [Aquibacillus salsiterrae]
MIVATNISKQYEQRQVLASIDLSIAGSEIVGIIGPNGSGKSTLMKLLSGAETPTTGTVQLHDKSISTYKQKELAKEIAVLQQDPLPSVGFTVREIVEMGRYPYQSWLGTEQTSKHPEQDIVTETINRLHLQHLEQELVDHLSGGEKQRVALAKVITQEPKILMLDEPTTFLDIGYQLQMMEIVKAWQREKQLTVVVILHDLNIASMYCDRLVLLKQGTIKKIGPPASVIDADVIASVYETRPIVINHPKLAHVPQIILDK